MSKFTNLTLGTNWEQDEWPVYVLVSHENLWASEFRRSVKYVPERICHVASLEACKDDVDTYWNLSCGHRVPGNQFERPDYCVRCGKKVVE